MSKNPGCLTFAHIGDRHISGEDEPNYRDFLSLIESMNAHLVGQLDFCVLPGDNADDGSASQYALIRRGLLRSQPEWQTVVARVFCEEAHR